MDKLLIFLKALVKLRLGTRIRRYNPRSPLRTFREDRMTSISLNFSIKLKINARVLIERVNALAARSGLNIIRLLAVSRIKIIVANGC